MYRIPPPHPVHSQASGGKGPGMELAPSLSPLLGHSLEELLLWRTLQMQSASLNTTMHVWTTQIVSPRHVTQRRAGVLARTPECLCMNVSPFRLLPEVVGSSRQVQDACLQHRQEEEKDHLLEGRNDSREKVPSHGAQRGTNGQA